jgi:hypothetical protein
MSKISTTQQLQAALRSLSGVGATLYKARAEAPRIKADIARFAWRLTPEERAAMHSLCVSQVAREFNLTAHTSSKQGGWPFYPQTFSEKSADGKRANDAVRYATQALRPSTKEAADKFATTMLAPKVTVKASSKDVASKVAKAFLALTTAQQRMCLEAIKAGARA